MYEDDEIFFDDAATELGPDAIVYDMASGKNGMKLAWGGQKDTAAGRISTLSEIFLEWYLFDSSKEKDVKTFLKDEELSDVFTEADIMDLMCGRAYLDDDILRLVILKLPFYIKPNRIQYLNARVPYVNPCARVVNKSSNLFNKIKEQQQQIKQVKKEKRTDYRLRNRDKINARKREWWAKNKDKISQQRHEHYLQNRDKMLERGRRWYHNNLDHVHAYDKKRRTEHKEERAAVQKKSVSKNPEHYKTYKHTWYEDNKEDIAERNKQNYLQFKQQTEDAKKVCAAFVFLVKLRKTNFKKYLELYTQQQKPLKHMLKTCVALQKMDINMCPLCNPNCGQEMKECCNPKVLAIPNVMDQLMAIAKDLSRQR